VGATPDPTDLKPVKTELPTYPNAAREQNIRGQVAIQILVSEAGDVEGSQVISGDPLLRDAALASLARSREAMEVQAISQRRTAGSSYRKTII